MLDPVSISLPNGLNVYLLQNHHVDSVAVQIRGLAGSIEENTSNVGAAHFVEHWLLQGATNFPQHSDLMGLVTAGGGKFMGITSRSDVVYSTHSLKENLANALQFISQIFYHPAFDQASFTIVKNNIRAEMKRIYDYPEKLIARCSYKTMFSSKRLEKFNLGEFDDLDRLTPHTVRKFYRNFYTNDRFVLCICGNFEMTEAQKYLNLYFSEQTGQSGVSRTAPLFRTKEYTNRIIVSNISQNYVRWDYQAPTIEQSSKYSTLVLAKSLSLLLKTKCERYGLAYKNFVDYFCTYTFGFISLYACSEPNKTQQIEELFGELTNSAARLINGLIVDQAKKALIANIVFSLEKTTVQANYFSEAGLVKTIKLNPAYELEQLRKVNVENIIDTASEIFTRPRYVTFLTNC